MPARRSQLGLLPPALITCAEIDPFRDEAVDYALYCFAPEFPPSCMCFRAPVTDSIRCCRIGRLRAVVRAARARPAGASGSSTRAARDLSLYCEHPSRRNNLLS